MDRRKWDRIVGGGWWFCDLVRYLAFAIAGGYSALSTAPIVLEIASWALMSVVQAGFFFGKKWAFWISIMLNAMVLCGTILPLIVGHVDKALYSTIFYFIESAIVFAYALFVLSRPRVPPAVGKAA